MTGLPRSCSWQDLKDFGRAAGDVRRSNVYGGGEGTLEYSNEDDFEKALRTLDDTEFKNRFDKAYVRVKRPGGSKRSRSRSYSRSRSRSRSRDRSRKDRSRSRSYHSDDKPAKSAKNEEDDGDRRSD